MYMHVGPARHLLHMCRKVIENRFVSLNLWKWILQTMCLSLSIWVCVCVSDSQHWPTQRWKHDRRTRESGTLREMRHRREKKNMYFRNRGWKAQKLLICADTHHAFWLNNGSWLCLSIVYCSSDQNNQLSTILNQNETIAMTGSGRILYLSHTQRERKREPSTSEYVCAFDYKFQWPKQNNISNEEKNRAAKDREREALNRSRNGTDNKESIDCECIKVFGYFYFNIHPPSKVSFDWIVCVSFISKTKTVRISDLLKLFAMQIDYGKMRCIYEKYFDLIVLVRSTAFARTSAMWQ